MKRLAAFLLCIALLLAGIASGETMPDRALAMEYLQVSKFSQTIDSTIDIYSQYGNMPEAERAELKKFMQDTMGWDAIKDQLAELIVKLYTKKELRAAITFEKSPVGASIAAKNELFAKQFAELLTQNMHRFTNAHQLGAAAAPRQ